MSTILALFLLVEVIVCFNILLSVIEEQRIIKSKKAGETEKVKFRSQFQHRLYCGKPFNGKFFFSFFFLFFSVFWKTRNCWQLYLFIHQPTQFSFIHDPFNFCFLAACQNNPLKFWDDDNSNKFHINIYAWRLFLSYQVSGFWSLPAAHFMLHILDWSQIIVLLVLLLKVYWKN